MSREWDSQLEYATRRATHVLFIPEQTPPKPLGHNDALLRHRIIVIRYDDRREELGQ